MKITKYRAERVSNPEQPQLLGFADVLLDDVLEISHIKIIEGKYGPFASLPSWRAADGSWSRFINPLDPVLRNEILDAAMAAYREAE